MDPIEKRELKRQAWRRLIAQRRRAGLLRGRVVAISLVCFALLWGVVFAQMATGNDPVLAGKEAVKGRTVASAKRKVDAVEARKAELRHERTEAAASATAEEAETADAEAAEIEAAEAEALEAEAAEIEALEAEPLVTSQS